MSHERWKGKWSRSMCFMFWSLVQSARSYDSYGCHHPCISSPFWCGAIPRYTPSPAPDSFFKAKCNCGEGYQALLQMSHSHSWRQWETDVDSSSSSWLSLSLMHNFSNCQPGKPLGLTWGSTLGTETKALQTLLYPLPWLWKASSSVYILYSTHTYGGSASLTELWFTGVRRQKSIFFYTCEM